LIQVLERAAAIMERVGAGSGATFSEIQQHTGLHKATLSHILKTLHQVGFVHKTSIGTYEVGSTILALARQRLRLESMAGVAEDVARALAEEIHESVTVGVLREGERYNLAKAEVHQSVTVNARLQQRPSPYDTTTGRVLLAGLAKPEVDALWARKGAPGSAWPAVRSLADLHQALAEIRGAGCAEEVSADKEVLTIAVPVHGPDGETWAAIGFGAPSYRLGPQDREAKRSALVRAAQRMERLLSLQHGMPPQVIEA